MGMQSTNMSSQSSLLHFINESSHQIQQKHNNVKGLPTRGSSLLKNKQVHKNHYATKHVTPVIPPLVVNYTQGQIGVTYECNANKSEEYLFEYQYKSSLLQHHALRVKMISHEASVDTPLVVVVQQQRGALSWHMPMAALPNTVPIENYTSVARTICPALNFNFHLNKPVPEQAVGAAPNNAQTHEPMQRLSIDVYTQSESPVAFSLTTTVFENFTIGLDTPRELTISPTTPVFLQFKFPKDVHTVLVHATSNSTLCAAVAVQKRECPVWDLEETMQFASYYQTMSTKAAITLTKSQFSDGFYVTLITLRSDEACAKDYANYNPDRSKIVTVHVSEKINTLQLTFGIITGMLFCSVLYVLVILQHCFNIRRDAQLFDRLGPPLPSRCDSSLKRRRRRRRSTARVQGSVAVSSACHHNLTDTSAHECTAENNAYAKAIVHCPSASETLSSLVVGTCRAGPNTPGTLPAPSSMLSGPQASVDSSSFNVPSATQYHSNFPSTLLGPVSGAAGSADGSSTNVPSRYHSSCPQAIPSLCSSGSTMAASAPTVLLSEGRTFDDLAELSREINESMSALQRDNPTIASEASGFEVIHESDSSINADPDTCSDEDCCIHMSDPEVDAVAGLNCTSQCNTAALGNSSRCSVTVQNKDSAEHRCAAARSDRAVQSCSTEEDVVSYPRGMDHGVYFPSGSSPPCRQQALVQHKRRLSDESVEGDDEFEASYCEVQSERKLDKNPASCASGTCAKSSQQIRRRRTFHVQDLSLKRSLVLRRRSYRYITTLLSCFIFYFVPVLQLVSAYQKVLDETGNQDVCYYNFLCTNPVGLLSDFNHVFSNIGYVSFGFLFAVVTYWRQARYNAVLDRDPNVARLGIPRDFGLYYALSMSLMMVGMLSACYHVCPNQSNFQFDTSFMYVIAVLLMLKLYQQRHPDITASADSVFIVLACSILFGVIGGLFGSTWFWVVSSVTHAFTCFLMSAYVYYFGRWSLISTMRTVYKNGGVRYLAAWSLQQVQRWRYWRELTSQFGTRMALLLTANLLNWALLLFGLVVKPRDYDTYLLGVFLLNLVVYVIFYLCMKRGYNEHLGVEVKLTLLFLVLVWVGSICVFFLRTTDWSDTPARSRDLNEHCIILHFYDWHDIWHFLSAVALFTSFYLIMIIDDDLDYTPRDLVAVF
ncbi:SID1 transmembrane family [Trinorchestia longiramus]|nr:SID1 transmembrane family [Trinorchestia longiramus]